MACKDISDKQVCQAYAKMRELIENDNIPAPMPYDYLQEMTGECFKVCYRSMERAYNRGYIEYGVSLRTGWLTDKGKALLKEKF
jgi:hypothetical protein